MQACVSDFNTQFQPKLQRLGQIIERLKQIPNEQQQLQNRIVETRRSQEFVSLERTPCFGRCPSYKVALYGDGRVEWVGKANVGTVGEGVFVYDGKTTRYVRQESSPTTAAGGAGAEQ